MATDKKQAGKVPKPTDGDRSGNYDKTRNNPTVNQGISNAGPTGNRNDRSDKGGVGSDDGKGSRSNGGTKRSAGDKK